MTFSGTKCDVCGTVKKETNHWLKAWSVKNAFAVTPADIVSCPFDFAPELQALDICGQDCLIRKVSELTGNLK